jgi:TonB family protein
LSSPPHSTLVSREPPMGEQRLFLRKKVPMPLPVELLPGKEVWLHDVGEGGLGVSGSSRLELGTSTFFTFEFPDANSVIEAAGVVAWCDLGGRAGVRFTRIKPDSSAVLKRWLKRDASEVSNSSAGSLDRSSSAAVQPPRGGHEAADLLQEIIASNLDPQAALDMLADRLVRLTRAAGAAIAWSDGSRGNDVICQASSGNSPAVGTQLDVGSSITGECYRTGNIVSVPDAQKDTRLDVELCRELDLRSLLIVPVTTGNEVIGVVEVFSPVAGNFDGGDILLLGSVAEIIAEVYNQQRAPTPAVKVAFDIPITEQTEDAPPAQNARVVEIEVDTEPAHPRTEVLDSSDARRSSTSDHSTPEDFAGDAVGSPNGRSRRYLLGIALLITGGIGLGDYLDWHFVPSWMTREKSVHATVPAGPPVAKTSSMAKPVIASNSDIQFRPLVADAVAKADHRVSPQLTPAKLIRRVEPNVPDFARDAGIAGPILLSATIGTDGRLKNIKLVSGNGALALEAFRAMREWRYEPYLLDGKPIEANTRIVINFHP